MSIETYGTGAFVELPEPAEIDDDEDADDEELDETPADVIAILGFDPKEFSDVEESVACGADCKCKDCVESAIRESLIATWRGHTEDA